MRCLYIVVLVFLYGVCADPDYFRKLDALTAEEPCSKVGGICTFAEDCPRLTGTKGQCPKQQRSGVECCYGISTRETRCDKNGGICIPTTQTCRPEFTRATDCPSDHKCCILV